MAILKTGTPCHRSHTVAATRIIPLPFPRADRSPGDPGRIAAALRELVNLDCERVLTTGCLSVDPDDVTRTGIRLAGAEIIQLHQSDAK
ncbi:MAG: hypothetical protein WAK57_06340 [Desulfobacterales bacterium]